MPLGDKRHEAHSQSETNQTEQTEQTERTERNEQNEQNEHVGRDHDHSPPEGVCAHKNPTPNQVPHHDGFQAHSNACEHEHQPHQERAHGVRSHEGTACQLDLAFLLPGDADEEGRFEKLREALEAHAGITNVHFSRAGDWDEVCVHYAPQILPLTQVLALARSAGAEIRDRYAEGHWFISGMNASPCADIIERALKREPGVLQASVAYGAGRLVVDYDTETLTPELIERAVDRLGYQLDPIEETHVCIVHQTPGGLGARLQLPFNVAAGGLFGVGLGLSQLTAVSALGPTLAYALSMLFGGFFSARGALRSVRQGRLDIESLMVLSAIGAAVLGAWAEGAFLLFLFSLGHALEHRALRRARNALDALGKLRPETARVWRDGEFVETPVSSVQRGDRVLVRPGDRVPHDGVVLKGESALEQAAITGESMPVAKGPGDGVFSGTLNTHGALEIEVRKKTGESVLDRVVEMVAEAEARKSPTQRFTQRFERRFVPIVLLFATILPFVLHFVFSLQLTESVLRAVAVLVAASPCALAISVPAAVLSAVARAARGGVVIKGGGHLETLGNVRVIAFDKTGTLTVGKPELVSIRPAAGVAERELLAVAAAAESLSAHPLSLAIIKGALDRGVEAGAADGLTAVHGRGIHADVDGLRASIGNLSLFEDGVRADIIAVVDELERGGQTTMVVRHGERFLGVLGVADTIREGAHAAIAKLRVLGVEKTLLLTGDNARVGDAVGAEVGVDEVRSALLPAEKVSALHELAGSKTVAMVGDGVNDAPALAAASVGIAMGGTGSDVALETADIVLMGDRLSDLCFAVGLARRSTAIIRQNLVVSLGVSALLVVAAVFGIAEVSHAVVVHEGSTLLVAFNGLRLLR